MQISLYICALVRQKGLVIKMRGIIKKTINAILALIIFAMCAVPAFAVQEREPNDSIVQATEISVNTVCYGTTHEDDIYDWYKFTISKNGYVWLDFTHDYGADSHDVCLYSYDGTEQIKHFEVYVSSRSEKKTSPKQGLSAGTYYVMIDRYSSSVSNYSLKVNFNASDYWEKEFNDTIVTANTISVGNAFYGSTHEEDKYDWYRFTISKNGYVWLDFTHDYGADSHDVCLYSYDGTEKTKCFEAYVSSSSEKKSSPKQGLSAGTYYVMIDRYSSSASNYSLKVNFSTNAGGGSSGGGAVSSTKATTVNSTKIPSTKPGTATSKPDYTIVTANGNEKTYQNGDFYYYIDINYNVVINNYSGSETYVEIPSEIDGKSVVGIADNAFAGTTAQVIYVPSSVTQFGKNAFGQDDGESREIMCEDGSYAQSYANSNGITNETVKDENEASKNAASKRKKAEKKSNESKKQKLPTSIIIIICVALASCIAIVVVIIVMNRKKDGFKA